MIKDRTILELIQDPNWIEISTAGRVLSHKKMGSVCFGFISDATAKIQYCIKRDTFPGDYKEACNSVTRGQHIAIAGTRFTTGTGELTINVTSITVVQSAHSGMADKWNGIVDVENIYRERYRDTSTNLEAAKVFLTRAKIISFFRQYLEGEGFIEWQSPVLDTQASGALAKPFITHSNEMDKDLYLRIATETSLKKAVCGGFDRVYEIGPVFRNEGASRSHMPQYLSLEYYMAYGDYLDGKKFFLEMLKCLLNRLGYYDQITVFDGVELNWNDIPTVLYRDLFSQNGYDSPDTMLAKDADEIFKKYIRPGLVQPMIVTDYPAHMSPMAKRRDDDENTVEQWQLVICGQEIIKAYSELTDPVIQRRLLEEQSIEKSGGNDDTMMLDEGFLDAISFGLPPTVGVGVGLERMIAILADKKNIRDVVFSPLMG